MEPAADKHRMQDLETCDREGRDVTRVVGDEAERPVLIGQTPRPATINLAALDHGDPVFSDEVLSRMSTAAVWALGR